MKLGPAIGPDMIATCTALSVRVEVSSCSVGPACAADRPLSAMHNAVTH